MNHGGGPVVDEAPKNGKTCLLRSLRHTSTSLINSDRSMLRCSSLTATFSPCHPPLHMVEKNEVLEISASALGPILNRCSLTPNGCRA